MGDMLSQAEIDALLGGGGSSESEEPSAAADEPAMSATAGAPAPTSNTAEEPIAERPGILTSEQRDILGEIGNISMGTAATTLFTLLNQKVWITTPKVTEITWSALKTMYDRPCVGIRVAYKEGIVGTNVLILKERDVKIITNLMMGGDGTGADIETELTEIDLSAIGEAMNQMIGSSSTSLSSLTKMKIDIDTPLAFPIDFDDDRFFDQLGITDFEEDIVATAFRMEIGTLIDSQIMQMMPTRFAIGMVDALKNEMGYSGSDDSQPPAQAAPPAAPPPPAPAPQPAAPQPAPQPMAQPQQQPMQQQPMAPQPQMQQPMAPQQPMQQPMYDPAAYGGYGMPQQPQMQQPMQQPMYDPAYGGGYAMPPMQQPMMAPQQQAPPQQNVSVQSAQFQNFDFNSVIQEKENIGIIMDVPLEVNVELGRTTRLIKEILEFGPGTVVELNRIAGEPVDVYVNGKHVAKGEVVVIDENFGVRITDIVSVENRI